MNNLEEMDKLLENYNLPKLKQEETEKLNRPITGTEIKTAIKNLPTYQSAEPGFTGKFPPPPQINFSKNLEKC